MLGWIIYFKEAAIRNESYINFHIEEGSKLGIKVKLILVEDLDFGVNKGQLYIRHKGSNISIPDFAICRAIYPLLNKHLEGMGIRTFNNWRVASICNDKARTYQFLAGLDIEKVDSEFCKNQLIKDKIKDIKGPTIIKTVEGHGGRQVYLLDEESKGDKVAKILKGIGKSDVVIQPLVGSRYQDLRVYVIGKEIIAGVLRTAKNGFKSNFSLGGQVELYQLSNKEKAIVNLIIDQFDFGLVGIDFIISDQGELVFNEIEDVVGSRMLYQSSDINIVNLYMEYIKEQVLQ